MDDAHDGSYAREPQLEDLVRLARALNAHHVRYVLIGGFAVIAHGGTRTTRDIDLLIDADPENVNLEGLAHATKIRSPATPAAPPPDFTL